MDVTSRPAAEITTAVVDARSLSLKPDKMPPRRGHNDADGASAIVISSCASDKLHSRNGEWAVGAVASVCGGLRVRRCHGNAHLCGCRERETERQRQRDACMVVVVVFDRRKYDAIISSAQVAYTMISRVCTDDVHAPAERRRQSRLTAAASP